MRAWAIQTWPSGGGIAHQRQRGAARRRSFGWFRGPHELGGREHCEAGAISLHQAIAMATTNAARVGRIAGRQRGLVPGEKADLIRFRWDTEKYELTVLETIVAGISVYKS